MSLIEDCLWHEAQKLRRFVLAAESGTSGFDRVRGKMAQASISISTNLDSRYGEELVQNTSFQCTVSTCGVCCRQSLTCGHAQH